MSPVWWILIGFGGGILVVGIILSLRRAAQMPEAMTTALQAIGDFGAVRTQVETLTTTQVQFQQALGTLESAIRDLGTKVVEASGTVKDDLGREIREARGIVEQIRTDNGVRRQMEEELRGATSRIEAVLTGHQARGAAGEQILSAAFKQFPPSMIDQDFRVNGRPVEYALILPNGKRLAIDSKWPAANLLERLATLGPGTERDAVAGDIERTLERRIREVAQYIDPASTLNWALAAVPDAAYAICQKVHVEGFRIGVIVVPYSLVVPHVLTLYRMHLQYAQAVDVQRLEDALSQIERILENLDRLLENSVARAATMLQNAYGDCRRFVGDLRGAIATLRSVPAKESQVNPPGA